MSNKITHISIVLDGSTSMTRHTNALIKAVDDLVAFLATRSTELDQETRVSVYLFNSTVKCLIYEKDVLRLPSIAKLYKADGWTALIDAAMISQIDLAMQPQKYGDHAFLTYILTDGVENRSKLYTRQDLVKLLAGQADNWTVATLVPDVQGRIRAQDCGFQKGNIAIWDTVSDSGAEEAVSTIRQATNTYMTARATTGLRGTTQLFSTDIRAVNSQTVASLNLTPLAMGSFAIVKVTDLFDRMPIIDFLKANNLRFSLGKNYYQLVGKKREKVQAHKAVAIVEKKTSKVYVGHEARQILGLPEMEVIVKADANPEYDIYIQSTANNRKVDKWTNLLVLDPREL